MLMAQFMYFTKEELRKLLHSGKLKALLLLSFLVGILFAFIAGRLGLEINLAVTALGMMQIFVFPLFMAMLGSDLLTSEFKDGTIKNSLKLPLSREFLFMGKVLAGWTAGALIVLSVFIPTFIGDLFVQGIPALSKLGASVAELGGAILFCGLLVVLANGVALWTGSGGVGLVVSIVLWIAMGAVGLFEPQWNRFLVTHFADWVQPILYSGDIGASVTTLSFMIAYYTIGTILGLWAFQRKEV